MLAIIAATYGWDTEDSDLQAVALRCLDTACDSLNSYTFEFNKTVETGLTLVAGNNYVDLPSPFWKESLAYLVETANTKNQPPLGYFPWVIFKRGFPNNTAKGRPGAYSLFNLGEDGRVYLAPNPDAATASGFTLTIEYYRRTQRFSAVDGGNSPEIPVEAEPYITHFAMREFAIHQHGAGHPDVAAFARIAEMDLFRLLRIDKEHPDARNQFRLSDSIPWSAAARRRLWDQWIDTQS